MSTRTDVHRPSALVTEDYEFVACGYYGTAGDPGYSPLAHEASYLIDEGWKLAGVSGGGCDHCGARLTYYAILKHVPTHTLIRVGETCLGNRFERSSSEFHALRKQAELDRAAQRVKKTRALFFAVHAPDAETVYEWCDERVCNGEYGWEGMRHRFVSKINREGETSEKFLRAMMRDMARTERRDAERAERDRIEAENSAPVVEGRGPVEGVVLGTRWQESDFGDTKKMLVRDDRGFKLWGTVPSAILEVAKGDRVRFTAKAEKSQDDETFGFYSRPTKAEVLASADGSDDEAEEKAAAEEEARQLEEQRHDRHEELEAKREERMAMVDRVVQANADGASREEMERLAAGYEAVVARIAELERLTEVVE